MKNVHCHLFEYLSIILLFWCEVCNGSLRNLTVSTKFFVEVFAMQCQHQAAMKVKSII